MQDSLQITAFLHILADNLDDTQGRSHPVAVLRGERQRHTTIQTSHLKWFHRKICYEQDYERQIRNYNYKLQLGLISWKRVFFFNFLFYFTRATRALVWTPVVKKHRNSFNYLRIIWKTTTQQSCNSGLCQVNQFGIIAFFLTYYSTIVCNFGFTFFVLSHDETQGKYVYVSMALCF